MAEGIRGKPQTDPHHYYRLRHLEALGPLGSGVGVGAAEIGLFQVSLLEIRSSEKGISKISVSKVGLLEISAA